MAPRASILTLFTITLLLVLSAEHNHTFLSSQKHIALSSIEITDLNQRIYIDFSIQFTELPSCTIFSVHQFDFSLLSLRVHNASLYIFDHLVNDNTSAALVTNHVYHIHMEQNKMKPDNILKSNIYISIDDGTTAIDRFIYHDPYMFGNHVSLSGSYEIQFEEHHHYQLYNVTVHTMDINDPYTMQHFEHEYLSKSVPQNIMIEDLSYANLITQYIHDFHSTFSDDVLHLNTSIYSFEFSRSARLKIRGNIQKLNFNVKYEEHDAESMNENQFLNHSDLFSLCRYPIPNRYNFSFQTKWMELFLDTIASGDDHHGVKSQYPECRDSFHELWDDPYAHMCDAPTSYLSKHSEDNDVYTKIFECSSLNGFMSSYRWFYSVQQLSVFADSQSANKIKIVVHDGDTDKIYSATSNADMYPIVNLRNNRSLSHPLYHSLNQSDTYYFDINAWNINVSDAILLHHLDNNPQNICHTFYPLDETQPYPENHYNLNEYLYDNCNLDDLGILSIDFVNQKCNVFNSNNISIDIFMNSGFKHISTGFIMEGQIDPESLSDNFDTSETILYAYGQHDPSQFYRFPDPPYYNFAVHHLSIGQNYKISFSFMRQCADFSIALYHIAGYESVAVQDDDGVYLNFTQTVVNRNILWRSSYNDSSQNNEHHAAAFVATSSRMDFVFELNMKGLSEISPTENDCYIDVTTDDLIDCIGGQQLLTCDSISNEIGNECAPFHLVSDAKNFYEADGHCYGQYGTHLLTNVTAAEYDIMMDWMNTAAVNETWLGVKRKLDNLAIWQWIDVDHTLFTEDPLYAADATEGSRVSDKFVLETEELSWADAQSACLSTYGTYLASIHSEDDTNLIKTALDNAACSTAWIGLNDELNEDMFVWSDATDLNYSNWKSGEPNNLFNQDYVIIRTVNNAWLDIDDTQANCYICGGPFVKNCRYFDRVSARLTNGNCVTKTLPFFCKNDWKNKLDFQQANWLNLPICIESKLNGFATLSEITVSPVYDVNHTDTIGCMESNVGILSVEPSFADSFGCHVTKSSDQDPMYQVFYEMFYELLDDEILYTNLTTFVSPNNVNDLLGYSAHVGIDIDHALNDVQMEDMLANDMMIKVENASHDVYHSDSFTYYTNDTFTSNIYPFSTVSTSWEDTACIGTIQNELESLSFSNMLNNELINVESYGDYQWIVPFRNFIDDQSQQSIQINVSLARSSNFFGDYAANLDSYAVLLPATFVTTLELSSFHDYWILNIAASFAHCLSIGYAQLRIYTVNSDSLTRHLIIKQSMLSTKCTERMSFEFKIPSIYFMHDNNINITALSFSNKTHKFTPFLVEWNDVDYSYRIQPSYVIGYYKSMDGISYSVPYNSSFISLSPYIITDEYRIMFCVILLFVLLGMFCGFFCVPVCDRKTKENYKIQICFFKWFRIRKDTKWVIDAKDVHIDAFGHVFDVFVKKKVITHRRNSTVRTRASLDVRRQQFGDRTTLLDKSFSVLPWVLLIGLSVSFTLSQFTKGRVLKKESQSVNFGLFILVIMTMIISLMVWALLTIIALCKYNGICKSMRYLKNKCCCSNDPRDTSAVKKPSLQTNVIELPKQRSYYNQKASSNNQHIVKEEDSDEEEDTPNAGEVQKQDETSDKREDVDWTKAAMHHMTNKNNIIHKPRRIYKRRKFQLYKHGPFLLADVCCRLMEAFIFTISFFITFVSWYSAPEIHAIGTDLAIAIRELNIDTKSKLDIVDAWQQNEKDSMLWYYTNKSIECREDMTLNLNESNLIMNATAVYHTEQMSPSILELLEIESWMSSRLNTILSSANLAEYMGSVDQVFDEIQNKAQDGIALLSNIKDYTDTLADAVCIAVAAPLQLCGGGSCANVGDGACHSLKSMIENIKAEVDAVMTNYQEIDESAISPQINSGGGQTLKPASKSDIDATTSDANIDTNENEASASHILEDIHTASTKSANDGESEVEYEEVSLDTIWSLPIFSILSLLGISAIIDTLLIYRKLIQILRRAIKLKNGIPISHDYNLDVARVSGSQLYAYNARKYFGYALTACLIGFPLIYFLYFVSYTGHTIDLMFYEVNMIDVFGLYQVWTIPVTARVITANEVLQLNMRSYNEHLLPALQIVMQENIEAVDATMNQFNGNEYVKVASYNEQKCQHQHAIAAYGDTMHCFNKYMYPTDVFTEPLEIEACSECFKDIAAMCLVANGLAAKEFVHHHDNESYDEFDHNPFKSGMAERRKHCHLDENIIWQINDTSTITINASKVFKTSNILSCPSNMIINKINMRGVDIDNSFIPRNESQQFIGASTNNKYVLIDKNQSWHSAKEICYSVHSDLASIHSDADNMLLLQLMNTTNQKTWIGLNDIIDETSYVWNDGSTYLYQNWANGQPDHSIEFKNKRNTKEWKRRGAVEDAVYIDPSDGYWRYADGSDEMLAACLNPNTMSLSSLQFLHLFDSIECIQLNRARLQACSEFVFDAKLFTEMNHEFVCEAAANISAYGDDAAWFLQGFTFQMANIEDEKDLSALISLRCCLVSGAVMNNTQSFRSPLNTPINVMDEQIEIASLNPDHIGVTSIVRGARNSIDGFIYKTIHDYIPTNGMQKAIHFDDYEGFSDASNTLRPQINVNKMQCMEGCHASFTSECSEEFDAAQGKNPFVSQFECDNINYTKAVKDEYHQCEISAMYVPYFYDYDKDKHKEMVIEQLTPYYMICGTFLRKITSSVWIFVVIKILFQIYYYVSQRVADKCCDGVFKRHQVVVKLLEDVTPAQHEASVEKILKVQRKSFILRAGTFGVAGHKIFNRSKQTQRQSINMMSDQEPDEEYNEYEDNDIDDDEYEYYYEDEQEEMVHYDTAQTISMKAREENHNEEGSDVSI